MITKRKYAHLIARGGYALLLCTFIFSGCKKPDDGITFGITTDIYKSAMLVQFVNANETSVTQPGNFTVKISGKDANKVVMGNGGKDYKAQNGVLHIALDGSATPTSENPIVFNVYANMPGFSPVSKAVSITNDSIPVIVTILAVEYANPADGTSTLQKSISLTNNQVPATTLQTTPTGSMKEKAIISFDAGTQLLDANNNPISASTLKSDIVHFGTSTQVSLSAFPGGLSPNDVEKNGQALPQGSFKTAGFFSINMTAGNTEVKSFSKPITIVSQLDPGLINPETGQSLKVGDTISIWSMNEQTGKWKFENIAIVFLDGTGKKSLSFKASHLSDWNIDWHMGNCNPNVPISLNVNLTTPSSEPFNIVLVDLNNQPLAANSSYYFNNLLTTSTTLQIRNMPAREIKFVAYKGNNYWTTTRQKIGETSLFNPCTNRSATINITTPPSPPKINVNFSVKAKCTNKNFEVLVGGWVGYRKVNSPYWDGQWVYLSSNKQYSFTLEKNVDYYVDVYYGSKWYSGIGKINETTFNFSSQNGLTNLSSYNAATNTLTGNFIFDYNCP